MAEVVATIFIIEGVGEGRIVYDDTNAVPDTDPAAEPGDMDITACDLTRFEVDVIVPFQVEFRRGGGVVWHSVTVTESASFNAGGPVQTVGDIPEYSARSV